MLYKVSFNSGKSFEDTVTVSVIAENETDALETALQQFPEYNNWNNLITTNM
jgi:hypothetical protein